MTSALEILRQKLKGNFYSRFSAGDTWAFGFDGFWLIAQEIQSKDERQLNSHLLDSYVPAREAIDKECVAKSIVVSSCLRKNVVDVEVDWRSMLTIEFENGIRLVFPTNTDTVDWQWAINNNGGDPYLDCIIGCFHQDEIYVESC
jgi:hypothetical protein